MLHYFPMNDASGKVTRIGVVVMELTEQKKLEDKLGSLVGKLEREKERLRMLLEVSLALNSTSDLNHSFPSMSASIRRVMKQDWTELSIVDESSSHIRTYVADSSLDPGSTVARISIPLKDSLCREAIAEKTSRDLWRLRFACCSTPGSAEQLLQNGIQSVCCMPFATPKGLLEA